jgi:hypothetical protein
VPDHDRHFLVLVSFEGRIGEVSQLPSVWVVPARELAPFLRTYQTRTVISRATMRSEGARFRDAWPLLLGRAADAEPGDALDPGRMSARCDQ